MNSRMQTQTRYVLSTLALVWLGMLLGVSFVATPVKFLAPSLSLPVALDVGRQTFGVFSLIEVVFALALLGAAIVFRHSRLLLLSALLIGSLVALQYLWLLPALDARVEIILQGGMPVESNLHTVYVAFEVVKLLLLGVIAWRSSGAFAASSGSVAADAH